jgi:hypothetical protein
MTKSRTRSASEDYELDPAGITQLHVEGLAVPFANALDVIARALRQKTAIRRKTTAPSDDPVTLHARTPGLALTLVVTPDNDPAGKRRGHD